MAAQKSRFKGGGHGGVTGMLTASIAPSFDCLARATAALEACRSATRLKTRSTRKATLRRPGRVRFQEQQRDQT